MHRCHSLTRRGRRRRPQQGRVPAGPKCRPRHSRPAGAVPNKPPTGRPDTHAPAPSQRHLRSQVTWTMLPHCARQIAWTPKNGSRYAGHLCSCRHRRDPEAALRLVGLPELMGISAGAPDIAVALIDGPVNDLHPDLAIENMRVLPGRAGATCTSPESVACTHGTYVAGILHAKRDSLVPGICPGCALLVRPIFSETAGAPGEWWPAERGHRAIWRPLSKT